MMNRSYSELKQLKTQEDRFNYLKLSGVVGEATFGYDRYLNQALYNSAEWKRVRREVIIRDDGCDMGIKGNYISGKIIIHHMNTITEKDIINRSPKLFDPENLICVSFNTHNAIHYGDETLLPKTNLVERKPNDQCPWAK